MGREYAHRRYGPNRHSLGSPAAYNNGWYRWNENGAGFGIFESNNHIAAGFLHDIMDDNVYNANNSLAENNAIRLDSIHGYTISSIFNQMGSSTTTAASLINNLRYILPQGVGNTFANYDSLKLYYGY